MGIVKEHYTFHIKKLESNLPPLEKNGFISQSDWMSILDTDWKGSPETLDDLAAKVENTDQLQGNSQRDLQENMPAVEIKHCPFDYGASATPLDSGVGSVVPFIDNAIICEAQPYHVIFDEDLNIRQMGNTVQMISSRDLTKTIKFGDIFYLEHPQIDLTARNILKYLDMIFMMQIMKGEDETNGKRLTLSLRGQIIWMKRQRLFLFLGSPMLTSFEDLQQRGMHFSDIAAHDVTRDLILFNQQRIAEVELARQLEQKQEELRVLMKALELEKSKTDSLLYSMLPKEVANLLREGKAVVAGKKKISKIVIGTRT
ncbi:putative guanylate cyclase soluble subunit beta-2-like [Apostichopus japonicus]|uniref:guanylate cyclase n=1 Tax=Stichopus japonicus TaxID=307972 RepID=A0A2G8JIR5_STIJA|nr:putative guanylate cyclase soluble subunit beta-2-like [Apostichopus japonicus]